MMTDQDWAEDGQHLRKADFEPVECWAYPSQIDDLAADHTCEVVLGATPECADAEVRVTLVPSARWEACKKAEAEVRRLQAKLAERDRTINNLVGQLMEARFDD